MKKKILFLIVLLISLFTLFLSSYQTEVIAATNYYSDISDTATGSVLKSELRSLITATHTNKTSYDDCKDPNIVKKTDGNASNSKIVLFWSELEVATTWDGGSTWNREHVWPQSLGWFETSGAGSDLHHIRPSDPSVNSSHNNNPYGEVTTNDYCKTSSKNGSIFIEAKCKNGYFEPGDSKKGDTARILFYLLVRYSESDSYSITKVAQSMDMLLEWNELDPVDASERRRNEAVYDIQGNRNPFIDNSFYADLIWGGAQPEDNPGSGSDSGSGSGSGSGSENTPNIPSDGKVATFELGANDTSKNDEYNSSSELTTYSESNNSYTLSLTNMSKVYKDFDNAGNSCLKLGTTSKVGSFSFTVPSEIDQVVILTTGYKSNNASVVVNSKTYSITTHSANNEYTNISVDTSSNKSVTISTTSSGYRCKINTIVFYDFDAADSGDNPGGNVPSTSVENALATFQSFNTKASLGLDYNYNSYAYTSSSTYSYTFTSQVYTSATVKELNGIKWDPETTLKSSSGTKYYGYDSTKGQQFGSANNPFSEVIFKTSDNILDGVTSVTIQASGASGTDATISCYVGTRKIGEEKSLTSTNKTYSFTSTEGLRGNVKFVIKQTTSKAIYIKGMSIQYQEDVVYEDAYSLNSANIRFGGYITKEIYDLLNNENTKWGVEYVSGEATNLTSSKVKTMYCTPAQVTSPNASETSSSGKLYQWSLLVTGLTTAYLKNKISARIFVEYEGVRYYMGTSTQSVSTLVNSYLSDLPSEYTNHTGILNYLKNN